MFYKLITIIFVAFIQGQRCQVERNVNVRLLETMSGYMNTEADPCVNFYDYACGNWEYMQGSADKYVDAIGRLEYNANKELAELVEQRMTAKKRETDEVYRKVRVYYESCRQQAVEINVDDYLALLKPGDDLAWPSEANGWSDAEFSDINWLRVLGRLRAIGFNGVLINEQLKNRNATSYIIQLDKADNNVDFDDDALTLLAELGSSSNAATRQLAEQVRQFKYKLKQLLESVRNVRTVNELTLAELTRRLPALDFGVYFVHLRGEALAPTTTLLVRHLTYFRRLHELLAQTRPAAVLQYIKLKLRSYLAGVRPRSNAPVHCIESMRAHMSLALNYIYEREHYQHVRNATDAVIRHVFAQMQSKFDALLSTHVNDFSVEELSFLRQKIRAMQLNIGNLPTGVSTQYYSAYYASLRLEPGNFYWNHLNLMQHANAREHYLLQLASAEAPEHTFTAHWTQGSPGYDQPTNRLLIPYAYLQWPIFHKDFHELFLFAELGNTLGHELMHGFDTLGLQYDAFGNPSMLFVDAMRRKPHMQRSLACLQREPTLNINEKLADFSGFRLAFEAYFYRPNVPKFRSALTLTNKQLFYIKFAQFFCALSPQLVSYDSSHDTPFKRVPQVMANNPEFMREFGCLTGTKIDMQVPCDMW